MDWATFFKDYGQSLFTLGGVLLGSLITFFINYLNLRKQSQEREKDRQEQRREAKVQTREKWIERDILVLMDSIDRMTKLLLESENFLPYMNQLAAGVSSGILTKEEYQAESKSLFYKLPNRYSEILQTSNLITKLVYSLGDAELSKASPLCL